MIHKLFWGGVILVIISFIGNTVYYQAQQMNEPVFLDHYYDHSDRSSLRFQYIANKNESKDIHYVTINGIDLYQIEQYPNNVHNSRVVNEYNHYDLREFVITVKPDDLEDIRLPFTFNEMTVHFSDGSSTVADIGEVILHKNNSPDNEEIYESRHYGSGSDGRTISSDQFKEGAVINEITYPFKEIKDNVSIKLKLEKGVTREEMEEEIKKSKIHPLHPLMKQEWEQVPGQIIKNPFSFTVDKGKQLFIYSQVIPDIPEIYGYTLHLKGATEDGDPFKIPVSIYEQPDLSHEDIKKVINHKGEE